MNEIKVVQGYQPFKRFEWTTEAFNETTGNPCREFRKNRHTAPDFFGKDFKFFRSR